MLLRSYSVPAADHVRRRRHENSRTEAPYDVPSGLSFFTFQLRPGMLVPAAVRDGPWHGVVEENAGGPSSNRRVGAGRVPSRYGYGRPPLRSTAPELTSWPSRASLDVLQRG